MVQASIVRGSLSATCSLYSNREIDALPEIKFNFVKSAQYTEVPVHGAIGGVSPRGDTIYMAVYAERGPLPNIVVHSLDDEGHLGDELREKRLTKDGIVRTVHFGMHLSIDHASTLRDWLTRKIEERELIFGDESEGNE